MTFAAGKRLSVCIREKIFISLKPPRCHVLNTFWVTDGGKNKLYQVFSDLFKYLAIMT
jgi:hypothetical protein